MTPTDELRRLLDERGAEYDGGDAVVYFKDSRGYKAMAYEAPRRYGNGVLCVHHTATPEQAVEATLGRGTCKAVYSPNGVYCSVCHGGGLTIPRRGVNALRNYCPNCGRKVVDE